PALLAMLPQSHALLEYARDERMADLSVLAADPVHSFRSGVGLQFREVVGRFDAKGFILITITIIIIFCERLGGFGLPGPAKAFFFLQRFFQPLPPHLPGHEAIAVRIVFVLVEQLAVFVSPGVAFAEELLVVEFVPFPLFVAGFV